MQGNDARNYYETLEVPINATQEEIYLGYIRIKNTYSKDNVALYSLMSVEECDDILNSIEEAYSILSCPGKRKEYDSARGIVQDYLSMGVEATVSRFNNQETDTNNNQGLQQVAHKETTSIAGDISKKVVQKKFKLDYTIDNNMEKEIEQTTIFTGNFLRKIREYKNVDLVRLSDLTKVSKTYLVNIEEDDYEKLPAPVYVRGFVYQYAKCLRLPPDIVAKSYLEEMKKKIAS